MPRYSDTENHTPLLDAGYAMPAEDGTPVEDAMPVEDPWTMDEFNLRASSAAQAAEKESRRRHRRLKGLVKLAAAAVAAASIFLAAAGADPLADTDPGQIVGPGDEEPQDTGGSGQPEPKPAGPDETEESSDQKPQDETETETETETAAEEDEEFPVLDHLDPDFDGDWAWSGEGSEEYVRIVTSGSDHYSYLVRGSVWEYYDPSGTTVSGLPGATYDRGSNTLHLSNFSADVLDVNLMGNGFTIELSGDSHIGSVTVWGAGYGGSLKIIGDGSLTVSGGLVLNAEGSGSCLMVGRGVTLNVSGGVAVYDSTLENSIWISRYETVEGGSVKPAGSNQYREGGPTYYDGAILDDSGNVAAQVSIHPAS